MPQIMKPIRNMWEKKSTYFQCYCSRKSSCGENIF